MKMMKVWFGLALALMGGGALAQGGEMDPFDYHVSDIAILQDKKVQSHLKVSEVQLKSLNRFADQHRDKVAARLKAMSQQKGANGIDPDDAQLESYFDDLKKNICKQLSKWQLKRLRELTLQANGLRGMLDSEVAKRIGITTTTLTKMRKEYEDGLIEAKKLESSAVKEALSEFKDKKATTEAEAKKLNEQANAKVEAALKKAAPEMEKVRKRTENNILAMVNATQKKKYQDLQGAPFPTG